MELCVVCFQTCETDIQHCRLGSRAAAHSLSGPPFQKHARKGQREGRTGNKHCRIGNKHCVRSPTYGTEFVSTSSSLLSHGSVLKILNVLHHIEACKLHKLSLSSAVLTLQFEKHFYLHYLHWRTHERTRVCLMNMAQVVDILHVHGISPEFQKCVAGTTAGLQGCIMRLLEAEIPPRSGVPNLPGFRCF